MKKVILFFLLFTTNLFGETYFPKNQWVTLTASSEKTILPGGYYPGAAYFCVIPVVIKPGAKYTLFAEWDDGKAMLLFVQGNNPYEKHFYPPQGALNNVSINISGGKAWRINFNIDKRSKGEVAYIVFASGFPGRKVRVMLKEPGDPDSVTRAIVKGYSIGDVWESPLYVKESASVSNRPEDMAEPARNIDFFPINQWVDIYSSNQMKELKFYGKRYFYVKPVRLEKNKKYTLFTEWDDGESLLLMIDGTDPDKNYASLPPGSNRNVGINISGGKAWRINFEVDGRSKSDIAYVVLSTYTPNRHVRVMIKEPADPDNVTKSIVKGYYIGDVWKTPLYIGD